MSLYDRSYMQPQRFRYGWPVLKWIFVTNLVAFVLQNFFERWMRLDLTGALALSTAQIGDFYLWTLLTYGLLHGGLFHFLMNSLFIYLFGLGIQEAVGGRGLLRLYVFSILCGGLFYLLIHLTDPTPLVGASGGLYGFLTVFCLIRYNEPIRPFLIPVYLLGKWILWFFIGIALFNLLFEEMRPAYDRGIAESAHLGGALAGWLYFKYVIQALPSPDRDRGRGRKPGPRIVIRLPRWLRGGRRREAATGKRFTINLTNRADLRKEADRILDKINDQGFGSLTEEEKRTLDSAREMLNR